MVLVPSGSHSLFASRSRQPALLAATDRTDYPTGSGGVLGLGVLLGDIVIAGIGIAIGVVGIALVIGLGKAITQLF